MEKMKKRKNVEKMMKKRKKNEEIWLHTQNPLRFPGFTVVVVTFSVEILDDFHEFASECVSFQRKSTTRFAVSRFFRRKVTIFIGRETKTHIYQRKNRSGQPFYEQPFF